MKAEEREQVWNEICSRVAELDTLTGIGELLGWDQQVQMPRKAGDDRARQSALMGRLIHERAGDPQLEHLIGELESATDLTESQAAAARNLRRAHDRASRVDPRLAEEISLACSQGFNAWHEAKEGNDFSILAPHLCKLIGLAVERARSIDPDRHPYEVMLEDYDPGTTIEMLKGMFQRLGGGLAPILAVLREREQPPSFDLQFESVRQLDMHRDIIQSLGYDMDRGTLQVAEHPFCASMGPDDIRIATRLRDRDLLDVLSSTIHEVGHGLYDQGLPRGPGGSAVHSSCSMGVHESQSRFWENQIGQSRAFCRWLQPILKRSFPDFPLDPEALFQVTNRLSVGPLRLGSDEVTYNLHIILRFELELALIEGSLAVEDLPGEWNSRIEHHLDVSPSSDAEGVLQDPHWGDGAFGYFPSYTLGNLYASSQFLVLQQEVPDLDDQIGRGEFSTVLGFLRKRIHSKGHLLDAPDLIRDAVGERDHVEDFLAYIRDRHELPRS